MPILALHPPHLSASTVLLLVMVAALFVALQNSVIRRCISSIVSNTPARPDRPSLTSPPSFARSAGATALTPPPPASPAPDHPEPPPS